MTDSLADSIYTLKTEHTFVGIYNVINPTVRHYTQWHTISKKTLSCDAALSEIKIERGGWFSIEINLLYLLPYLFDIWYTTSERCCLNVMTFDTIVDLSS